MKITKTLLQDCFVLDPVIFNDNRGYFFESFNSKVFKEKTGLKVSFVQDNEAFSNRGVLRGLHFQKGSYSQAKLVRVIKGKVLDVVVDIRPESKTYGKHFSIILSEENKMQLFVPRGFAHGYSVLEDNTIFAYKCDNFYNKESESGITYNDSELNIDWGLTQEEIILSEKDKALPSLKNIVF